MNNVEQQYLNLIQEILDEGVIKQDRTGVGTKSVFGRSIRHKMNQGFPLLTTKKMYWKGIVTELLWFLRGDTNITYLIENDCHIWDGDAYKAYTKKISQGMEHPNDVKWDTSVPKSPKVEEFTKEEFIAKFTDADFAKRWGELGPVYGKQWRNWSNFSKYQKIGSYEGGEGIHTYTENDPIDQIQNLINDLKNNPDSRRLMVTAWNPADLENQVLPPCHYGFQVWTRELTDGERADIYWKKRGVTDSLLPALRSDMEKDNIPTRTLSLLFNMRSCDVPLGLPFNLASYGLLLEIIAKQVNMIPEELTANLGDTHIYMNQIDGVREQITRIPYELPRLVINNEFWNHEYQTLDGLFQSMEIDDFTIKNYKSHPSIKIPLSN